MVKVKNYNENFNIPNILSAFRIILIIPFFIYFLGDNYIGAAIVLILSGISDMLDGILARKLNQITRLGKILDPIADKLTLTAVVICLGIKFHEIIFLMVVFIVKDILMLIAGTILIKNKIEPPQSQWYGKLGTVFFYFSVIIIVGQKAIFNTTNSFLSITLLSITAIIMLYALFKYFLIFLELMKKKKDI